MSCWAPWNLMAQRVSVFFARAFADIRRAGSRLVESNLAVCLGHVKLGNASFTASASEMATTMARAAGDSLIQRNSTAQKSLVVCEAMGHHRWG